ncbi:MAG TPA: lysylphosphatidylglycerol synthase transmembrane domain-containing protein [Mycobacteriales bacterium]|nr:lysylphosphatidylglycerol synthase transmembrane domain-containing protein [Mycobacteriales bacterium]
MSLRSKLTHSKSLRVAAVLVALAVPAVTLPGMPRVSPWPAVFGMLPWIVGKYVLCPLRWHALSEAGQSRRWHLRAYAESELMGLLTPGHVGADLWRMRRLHRTGMPTPSAAAEVGIDRLVGAIGLSLFVVFAGATMPTRMLLTALGIAAIVIAAALVVRRIRPELIPKRQLPHPKHVAHGVLLSATYQITIGALLYGTVSATGHSVSPMALLGAFGACQVAGAVPGPNGASPRDGAFVVALMTLGVPWRAAVAAVALMASLAWLPALTLGGGSLLISRRASRRTPALAVA